MTRIVLTERDRKRLKAIGIDEDVLLEQIEMFKRGAPPVKLLRPATIGDGIVSLPEEMIDELVLRHKNTADEGRFMKFVPASGAATRMFDALKTFAKWEMSGRREYKDEEKLKKAKRLLDSLESFAFYDDLRAAMERDGLNIEEERRKGNYIALIDYLMGEKGIKYEGKPKALIKFHRHGDHSRTALEEHLVEAASYVRDKKGICRLHFTVSPSYLEDVIRHYKSIKSKYEKLLQVFFLTEFSVQEPSTDTIAVDLDNNPIRDSEGNLIFRPAGHGALIKNLNNLNADLVYIKNIDNVAHDDHKAITYKYKKILGGYLLFLQQQLFDSLMRLEDPNADTEEVERIAAFARHTLNIVLPAGFESANVQTRKEILRNSLNRPLRVCGMVKNTGEPGGGPFWVRDRKGGESLQIVESAQIDMRDRKQREIFLKSTHFNPVDIVCGLRNYRGEKFDLMQFVDRSAYFIARKTFEGRPIKALELPGLWNGAMAGWITVLVEVPIETFTPVKEMIDLLRPEHQPSQKTGRA